MTCPNLTGAGGEGTGMGGGGAGASGGAGVGGGGTGAPTNCDPTGAVNTADKRCGVFVWSNGSDDVGDGTPDHPYRTFAKAIADVGASVVSEPWRKHIYACNDADTPFGEAVVLASGVVLHGGLDCKNYWHYDPTKKTVLTAPADTIPLTAEGTATGVEVLDFSILAAGASMMGGSSVAVLVSNGATATFTSCDLIAGDAKDGQPGEGGGMQAAQAVSGNPGSFATDSSPNGGSGGTNAACGLHGGDGGNGGKSPNEIYGHDGTPGDLGAGAPGGTGEDSSGMACKPGENGGNEPAAAFGTGASGSGNIDTTGYHGDDGKDGIDGKSGKSGGGGGGSKAVGSVHGAGGGGGGAGGCGGKGGKGGKAGGSSIALVSVGAIVQMTHCNLKSGKGGNGGVGGDGQFGQLGGDGGLGGKGSGNVVSACAGGTGGKGGSGGHGGGGRGGHSLGVARSGTAPTLDTATLSAIVLESPGQGGKGGNNDENMNHGDDGQVAPTLSF